MPDNRVKYDWELFTNGDEHFIEAISPKSLRVYLYQQAKKRQLQVNCRVQRNGVRFRFFKTQEEYTQNRSFRNSIRSSQSGEFVADFDNEDLSYLPHCTVCNRILPPITPEGKTTCHKMDWDRKEIYAVHGESI